MSEQENRNGFGPENKNDLWEQERRQRRVIKYAIKEVYDRCARKEISGDDLGVEIGEVFVRYIKEQFPDLADRNKLRLYSRRDRQGFIDHIMFYRFHKPRCS